LEDRRVLQAQIRGKPDSVEFRREAPILAVINRSAQNPGLTRT
jgi:hypothetical protein